MRYPKEILRLNTLLRADLGQNPLYSWVWSEDLIHVMNVLDQDGNPQYVEDVSPAGLYVIVPKTTTRKLLPEHHDQWVICALIEIDIRDGSLKGTGDGSWVPVSSCNSGPVVLPRGEEPSVVTTQCVIDSIRKFRTQKYSDLENEWAQDKARREKQHWATIHDIIKDAGTAYANAPGMKGHVSFPAKQDNSEREAPLNLIKES